MFHVPNVYRIRQGTLATDESNGNIGAFTIPFETFVLIVIASDGLGWEHVSISLRNRTPNWREMCFIKDLFWDEEDCVVQYHPPKSEYINTDNNCLHLWRPTDKELPRPDPLLVGIKGLTL